MTLSSYATSKLTEEKVFKDPIHRFIHVQDQLIWDLIKTKEFQRLVLYIYLFIQPNTVVLDTLWVFMKLCVE